MARATKVTINLDAIRYNYQRAKEHAPNAKIMAVVKANAYGHGMREVAAALSEAPAFAVAIIDEAIELRAYTTKPILILEGVIRAEELAQAKQYDLIPAIHNQHQLDLLHAHSHNAPRSYWIVMDTGMSRLGFKRDQIVPAIESLLTNDVVEDLVVYSHMANASSPEMASNKAQLVAVDELMAQFPQLHYSLANSAAIMASENYHKDWGRAGIMLYGGSPFDDITHPESQRLRPAMSLTAEVIAIRDLQPGESAGYGSTWTAERPSKLATIAVGYADGYPRHAPSGTPVYIRGQRLPLAGRVSMDMIMVDITDHPVITVGDMAELFGDNISINEVAQAADTISYHLMTSISARVRREYHSS